MHRAVSTGRRIVPEALFFELYLKHILVIYYKLLSSHGLAHDHAKSYKFLILVRNIILKISFDTIRLLII